MKAIRMHDYGSAEVLRTEDAPRPEAGDGQLRVRVVAASVNPIDWKVRAGHLKEMLPLAMPWTPGLDFSGVVDQIGRGVTDLQVGDEVFGKTNLPNDGSYAEYVVVARTGVAARPRSVDHAHAAAVPLAALTAWQGLFGKDGGPSLELAAGQTLLVLGAAGGVGGFAVQLAAWKGARVLAVARPGEEAHLAWLGVAAVVDLDAFGIEPVDAVLDLVGGEVQAKAWPLVKRGGALASTMGAPSESEATAHGVRAVPVHTETSAAQLAEIAGLIDAGKLQILVSHQVPLAEARRAHQLLEAGGVHGKIVLTVGAG